jgi:hypothetical protein
MVPYVTPGMQYSVIQFRIFRDLYVEDIPKKTIANSLNFQVCETLMPLPALQLRRH